VTRVTSSTTSLQRSVVERRHSFSLVYDDHPSHRPRSTGSSPAAGSLRIERCIAAERPALMHPNPPADGAMHGRRGQIRRTSRGAAHTRAGPRLRDANARRDRAAVAAPVGRGPGARATGPRADRVVEGGFRSTESTSAG